MLDPEEILAKDERAEKVLKAIDSLDNKIIKELVILRDIQQLSYEEIAKKLGVEYSSTLRINVRRGRAILKEKLKDINPFT